MGQKGYKQFITDLVKQYPYNTPIYTVEIANGLAGQFNLDIKHARALVNVNLIRIEGECELTRYRKGIYYKAEKTVFGQTKLNPARINRDRYINRDGDINGYETGAAFLNQIGLTTQIPKYKKYATNLFKQRGARIDKNLQVIIKKPKVQITKENYQYLQLLDAIENKDKIGLDAPNPEELILGYINQKGLELKKLFAYAKEYYNTKTKDRIFNIVAVG